MIKKYAISGVLLMLFGLLSGCGQKSIEAEFKSVYADTMDCMVIEGEKVPEAPEPEFEPIVLTKDTDITYGISAAVIKADRVEFRYDETCFSARVYSVDADGFSSFLREGKHGKVPLCRGEELMIEEIALLDASHTIYIRLR